MKKRILAIVICIAILCASATAFAEGEVIKGDLLGKGKPTLGSFSLLGQYLLGTKDLSDSQKLAADINGDGNITMGDFAILGKFLLDSKGSGSHTGNANNSDIKVLVMPRELGIPYYNATETGAKMCAEDYGFEVIYDAPTESDATQQVNMLQDYIARGDIDAIAIAPNDPDGIAPILKQATDAGIKVISWDTPALPYSVLYCVQPVDNQEYGESVWGAAMAAMGDAENYAILTGRYDDTRLNTWISYGEAYRQQNYPDKHLVQDKIATNESQQEAYSKTLDLLKAYPDVKGIICMSAPTVPGAGQAIQELGLSGEITVIGSGMPKDCAPYLKDKSVTASYLWDVENLGYLAAYVAYICATGQDLQDNLTIDAFDAPIQIKEDGKTVIMGSPLIITDQNVDNFDY